VNYEKQAGITATICRPVAAVDEAHRMHIEHSYTDAPEIKYSGSQPAFPCCLKFRQRDRERLPAGGADRQNPFWLDFYLIRYCGMA
jgi:hypothetical protein